MPASKGYAALSAQSALAPFSFSRREPGVTEIAVEILYCGVCHSDLHMARNEWGTARRRSPSSASLQCRCCCRDGGSRVRACVPGREVRRGGERAGRAYRAIAHCATGKRPR